MRICYILLLLISFNLTSAQTFTLSYAGKQTQGKKSGNIIMSMNGFVKMEYGDDSKGRGSMKDRQDIELIKLDDKFNEVKRKPVANGARLFGPFAPFLKSINKKSYLFYYQAEGKESGLALYAAEVDESTLDIINPRKVLTIDQKAVWNSKPMQIFWKRKMLMNTKAGNGNTVIVWANGVNNEISFSVLDQDLNLIWSKSEAVNKATEIYLTNACIDGNNNVYISYSELEKAEREPFLIIGKQKGPLINKAIEVDGGKAYHAFVSQFTNNRILITGTYLGKKYGEMMGAFTQQLNIDNNGFTNKIKYPFPDSLIKKFDEDMYASSKNGIFANSDFEQVVMDDGTVSLSADLNRFYGQPVQQTASILHILFKKDGVIFNRIPKMERGSNDRNFNYFIPVIYKDKIILFYNDSEKIAQADLHKSAIDHSKAAKVTVAAIIDKNGNVTRKILSGGTGELEYYTIHALNESLYLMAWNDLRIGHMGKINSELYKMEIVE